MLSVDRLSPYCCVNVYTVFLLLPAVTIAARSKVSNRFRDKPKILATYELSEHKDIVLEVRRTVFTLRSKSLWWKSFVFASRTWEHLIGDGFWVHCHLNEFLHNPANAGKQCYVNILASWYGPAEIHVTLPIASIRTITVSKSAFKRTSLDTFGCSFQR